MSAPGDAWAPRDPSTFTVTGGEAFRLTTEALDSAAGALGAAASFTEALAARIQSARAAVQRGSCRGSAAAMGFDTSAADLAGQTMRAALEEASARRAVGSALAGYIDAEGRAAGAVEGLPRVARWLAWGLVPPTIPWGVISPVPGRRVASGLRGLGLVGSVLPPLAPWVPAGTPKDRISIARRRVAAGSDDASTLAYAGQSLTQAQGSAPLEDGTHVPDSSVLVERIPRADGSVAVMVTVPGTQSWAVDDRAGGVFDVEGNLDAMAAGDSHARQLIERALADQDLEAGDAVVFNAHSQGSLHVLGLLEDPGFRSRYPVAAVTILGGMPTAFRLPEDVPLLAVSNRDDVVPALSGIPSVPRPNVVDVRTPAPEGGAGGYASPVTAHDITRYAADARALDASTDRSVRGYAAVLGAAVGTGIVGAGLRRERYVYTGTDTRTPPTAGAPAAAGPSATGATTATAGLPPAVEPVTAGRDAASGSTGPASPSGALRPTP